MTLEEEFRLLVSGYYGIYEMDEYELKVYVLKEIENYIKEFVQEYKIPYNYLQIAEEIERESLKTKLQDSLLVLNKILLRSSDWLQTHRAPPSFASRVLGLKVCTTTPGPIPDFIYI